MNDFITSLVGMLPNLGTLGIWITYALALSGTASLVLKVGTPILQKLAALTKTDKDDKVVQVLSVIGTVLGFIAMNPSVQKLEQDIEKK